MIRVLWFFGLGLGAAVLAVLFAGQTGWVRVSLPGQEMRLSIGVAVLIVVLLAAFAFFGLRILSFFSNIPGAFSRMTRARRERQGYLALTRGMIAAAAGDLPQARLFQRKADALLEGPPLGLLLAAQTAQLEGNEKAVAQAYNELLTSPDTAFLGLRGLYTQALRNGAREEALSFAERAYQLKPKTPWVVHALFDLAAQRRDWKKALEALDAQVKAGVLDADVVRRRRAVVLAAMAKDALGSGNKDDALRHAYEATGLAPGLVPAAVMAARLYLERTRTWKAAGVIEAAWAQHPHPELAEVYAGVKPQENPQARLIRFESLMLLNPDHAEARVLKAATRLKRRDAAGARDALLPLLDPVATVRVSAMMADICEAEGDVVAALGWRERALNAPPDGFWACARCGEGFAEWDANCPACGSFDTLSWRAPKAERLERLPAPGDDARAETAPARGPVRGEMQPRTPVSRLLYRMDGDAPAPDAPQPVQKREPAVREKEMRETGAREVISRPPPPPVRAPLSVLPPPEEPGLPRAPDDPGPGGDEFGEPEPPKNPLTNPHIKRRP